MVIRRNGVVVPITVHVLERRGLVRWHIRYPTLPIGELLLARVTDQLSEDHSLYKRWGVKNLSVLAARHPSTPDRRYSGTFLLWCTGLKPLSTVSKHHVGGVETDLHSPCPSCHGRVPVVLNLVEYLLEIRRKCRKFRIFDEYVRVSDNCP